MARAQQLTPRNRRYLFPGLTCFGVRARSDSTRHGGLVVQSPIVCLSLMAVLNVRCGAPVEPEFEPTPIQDDVTDQLPVLGSSMVGGCVPETSCAQLRLVIDLTGTPGLATKVNLLSLVNPSIGKWNWVNAIAVLDGNGNPTGFSVSTVSSVAQILVALGAPAVEPLTVIMDATGSTGTEADLVGAFTYVGTAIEVSGGNPTVYEFKGKGIKGGS